jgi:hypothetical protein
MMDSVFNKTRPVTGWAWPSALAVATVAGSLAASCMMPFVALSVLATATMPAQRAAITIAAIWAANQIFGFVLLGYPATGYTVMWGAALGLASLAAGGVGGKLLGVRPEWRATTLIIAFGAAFATFEGLLFGFAAVVGGTETFAAPIVLRILANEACWFAGLSALYLGLARAAPRWFGPAPALRIA